jgi:two-component system nitrogen regulation sensor histidine kinase NtrY
MRGPATRVPLRRRIFWAMLAVTALGFLLTAATTLKNFSDLDSTYNAKRLLRKEAAMARSLDFALHAGVGDTLEAHALSWSIMPADFATRVVEISAVHHQPFAVYRLAGGLFVSSTVSSPENKGFAIQVDPEVTIALANGKARHVVSLEDGSNMAYWHQLNAAGRPVALVAARYEPRKLDELGRRDFMGRMGLVYFVILLAASLMAWALSRSIVRPLVKIGEAMEKRGATGKMESIEFDGSDEVSRLVRQYNRMVDNVRESAEALAHSEREGAWRQMAMQVAHEIKNPLTPMKLGIQQLERAIGDEADDLNDRFEKLAAMLHAQIDSLSRMATGFGSLARLSSTAHVRLQVEDVLSDVCSLHAREATGPVAPALTNATVMGDREQLVRLFGNLVLNAQQAIGSGSGTVELRASEHKDSLEIAVVDNGPGVPSDLVGRIFEPQFTTRGSGSGLGLAICRAIAEDHGAVLDWHESPGGGATFTVTWPAAY